MTPSAFVKTPRARKAAALLGAVVCLALAAFLVLLAVDVSRVGYALPVDDDRYAKSSDTARLWSRRELVPRGLTRDLLSVDDDLAYRRAVRAVRNARLDEAPSSDPEAVLQRAEAEERLADVVEHDTDPVRRSRALSILGVLRISAQSADPTERAKALEAAVASFQEAIALDPGNDDAKYNLEIALRRGRGVQTVRGGPAPNPSAAPGSSRGAATGPPGSGY